MANTFTITTPATTLKADANGRTTTVFTVTNTTSRPLRGIAKIKPLGNTEAAWLKIEGEAERDFPAGGTHQFTVNFTKPKPTVLPQPAETFQFRLDAVSTENPDEDFTEGPVVLVEIPEQKEETTKFPWWILIVIGVLLIVGVIVAILLLRNGENGEPTPTPRRRHRLRCKLRLRRECQRENMVLIVPVRIFKVLQLRQFNFVKQLVWKAVSVWLTLLPIQVTIVGLKMQCRQKSVTEATLPARKSDLVHSTGLNMNKIVIIVLVLIVVIFVVFVTWGSLTVDQPVDAKNINQSDWGKTINNLFGGLQKSIILDCKVKSPAGAERKCEQLPLEIKVEAAEEPWLPFMEKTTFRTAKLVLVKGQATVTYFDKKGRKGIKNPQRFELPNPENDNSEVESLVILEEGGTLTISCKNNTSCQVGQM